MTWRTRHYELIGRSPSAMPPAPEQMFSAHGRLAQPLDAAHHRVVRARGAVLGDVATWVIGGVAGPQQHGRLLRAFCGGYRTVMPGWCACTACPVAVLRTRNS